MPKLTSRACAILVAAMMLPAGAVLAGDLAVTPAPGPIWVVDADRSSLDFEVLVDAANSGDAQLLAGRFESWQADIVFDPADPASASIRAEVDLASVATGSASFDQQLGRSGWFDTAQYPTALFEAQGVEIDGGGGYLAQGALNLRGVTLPLTLAFDLEIDAEGRALAHGIATVARLDFGVGSYAPAELASAQVDVLITIQATPAPAVQ